MISRCISFESFCCQRILYSAANLHSLFVFHPIFISPFYVLRLNKFYNISDVVSKSQVFHSLKSEIFFFLFLFLLFFQFQRNSFSSPAKNRRAKKILNGKTMCQLKFTKTTVGNCYYFSFVQWISFQYPIIKLFHDYFFQTFSIVYAFTIYQIHTSIKIKMLLHRIEQLVNKERPKYRINFSIYPILMRSTVINLVISSSKVINFQNEPSNGIKSS